MQGLWVALVLGSAVVLASAVWRRTRVFSPVLALCLVPLVNLVSAAERSRQKRTMGELRSLGTAIETYSVDHDGYPVPAATPGELVGLAPPLASTGKGWTPLQRVDALAGVLEPTYISAVPRRDAFGNPIYYASTGRDYVVVSAGRDGVLEPWAWRQGPGRSWDDDYVFCNGQFHQW